MNKFESERSFAERMKRCYPPGTRLVLLSMDNILKVKILLGVSYCLSAKERIMCISNNLCQTISYYLTARSRKTDYLLVNKPGNFNYNCHRYVLYPRRYIRCFSPL